MANDSDLLDSKASDQTSGGRESRLRYGLLDVPPWWQCIFLAVQQFLTMLGGTVLIPQLLVPAMGGNTKDLANTISTAFFGSGICTLLQTLAGARLPIIQGGSFAYVIPALAITAVIQSTTQFESDHDRFLYTMRVLQGGIMGSSFFIIAAGAAGLVDIMMRFITPLTVAANIAVLGLALYDSGFPVVGTCVQLGLVQIVLIIVFALYMPRVKVLGVSVFGLFPVILSLGITWLYAYIMTVAGVYDNSSHQTQKTCTTWPSNTGNVLAEAPWFRVPYPGQWGSPIFTTYGVFTMLAGAIPAALETLGDLFAAARLSGVPRPPRDVIGQAVAVEGVCCCIQGALGTGSGSTAYAENIGAIEITGVASRRVIQLSAVIMMLVAVIGKFGALLATIPQAIIAGLFCVMFGLIVGVGLSYLQHVDLESMRNLLILGFSLYMGLSVPAYFAAYTQANGHGPINTSNIQFNNVMNSIFGTAVAVTCIITLFLDNSVRGTERERGLHVWREHEALLAGNGWWEDDHLHQVYGWPFGLTLKWKALKARALSRLARCIPDRVRQAVERVLGRIRRKHSGPGQQQLLQMRPRVSGTVGIEEEAGLNGEANLALEAVVNDAHQDCECTVAGRQESKGSLKETSRL